MKPTVEAKNICFNYHSPDGETEAIKNLSFTVEKGEFVSIVGPSGCGKPHQREIQQISKIIQDSHINFGGFIT
ncbi:MAG: ATP-binding cassette domain-containing protein [Clostridiales bacterium]|nr:ATP-binding cassette domain-containing protein [Clostridiales bacterium]